MRTWGLRPWLSLTARLLFFSLLLTQNALAAQITAAPAQGPAGTTVAVTGAAWPPGDLITFSWNFNYQLTVASVKTSGDGTFAATVTVPQGAPMGVTYIDAGSQAAFLSAQAPFTVTAASSPSPLPVSSGWYSNGVASPIYENDLPGNNLSGLRIFWGNSYVYQFPGTDPLYWYAQIVYLNKGNNPLTLDCIAQSDPSLAKENMRGTPNSGIVAADDTFCSRAPSLTFTIGPGTAYYGWAIFHNVPWRGSEVSLQLGTFGSTAWVDPWHFSFSARPPAECPAELVTLGICQQGGTRHARNVPDPAAYQIAQEIGALWKRFAQLTSDEPPASLTDGIIAAGCFAGTMAILLRDPIKAYSFEVKCVMELQTIAQTQCNNGDYACFIKYMLTHPTLVQNFIPT